MCPIRAGHRVTGVLISRDETVLFRNCHKCLYVNLLCRKMLYLRLKSTVTLVCAPSTAIHCVAR
jgi:hypothetical protein